MAFRFTISRRGAAGQPGVAPDVDYGTDVDALLGHVSAATRVVFLANPNNPTGSFLPRAELARLHAGLRPDILLVVDHAYGEYLAPEADDGALALAQSAANVLVTFTFRRSTGWRASGLAGRPARPR